jgi:enoyl-[acyl-carrier-protein] reductase (NADH)
MRVAHRYRIGERRLGEHTPVVADPIAFLLSDVSSAMTGSAMSVDGAVLAKV